MQLKTFPTNWNKKRIVKKRYGMKRTSMVPYPSTKFQERKRKEFRKDRIKSNNSRKFPGIETPRSHTEKQLLESQAHR